MVLFDLELYLDYLKILFRCHVGGDSLLGVNFLFIDCYGLVIGVSTLGRDKDLCTLGIVADFYTLGTGEIYCCVACSGGVRVVSNVGRLSTLLRISASFNKALWVELPCSKLGSVVAGGFVKMVTMSVVAWRKNYYKPSFRNGITIRK